MKLTINQKALTKALAAAGRVAPKNTTIPIISHVHFEAKTPNIVSIRATDLDIEITCLTDARVEQGGAVCVPAAAFRDISNKLNDGADIRLELDDARLSIKAGRSRFHLATLPANDWPEIVGNKTSHEFDIQSKALGAMIAKVSFAMSNEQTRYYLNGVYMHPVDDGTVLRMVATDGHRLSRVDCRAPAGSEKITGVIIPRKTIAEVERLLKDAPPDIVVCLAENFIRFEIGATVLASKLVDGTFPDYPRVIPKDTSKKARIDSALLSAAVARVSTIQTDRGRSVKFEFDGETLGLFASNADMGDASDEIACEWSSEKFSVGFNAQYVTEIISAIGGEKLTMKFVDPGSPAIFTNEDDESLLTVLMPMRV